MYIISYFTVGKKKLTSRKKAKSHYRKYFVIPVVEWNSILLIVLPNTNYIYTCIDWFSLFTSKFWGTHKTLVIIITVKSIQNIEQNAFFPHLHENDKKKISTTVLNYRETTYSVYCNHLRIILSHIIVFNFFRNWYTYW